MTPPLTLMQLWALISAGPIAMMFTVLVGILVNNAVSKAHAQRIEGMMNSRIDRLEGVLGARIDVLGSRIDALTERVKALEDTIHSPLAKR